MAINIINSQTVRVFRNQKLQNINKKGCLEPKSLSTESWQSISLGGQKQCLCFPIWCLGRLCHVIWLVCSQNGDTCRHQDLLVNLENARRKLEDLKS